MATEITLIPSGSEHEKVETSIRAFNEPLSNLLEHLGLPVDDVLNPIEERRKIIFSLTDVLQILPYEERGKAFYLSKFTVAVTAGMFDGALNFLWDETIIALRRLAASFDLNYFFSVAETVSARYKNLQTDNDLEAISDYDLLDICRRIGLVSDVNYHRLEHTNYLRNHASAAHPNSNELTGHEMVSLLEGCLKYAITAQPDHSAIQLKVLLGNVRSQKLDQTDFPIIGKELELQNSERIADFTLSIFGIYTDPRQSKETKDNIAGLAPYCWAIVTEDVRLRIGSKFGQYRKNGESERKELVESFLGIVNGLNYKDEDSLAAELIDKLQELRTSHFAPNNFYNEFYHAKAIKDSLPKNGTIPAAAMKFFVKIISICFAGNGLGFRLGVDERALPYYQEFIEMFSTEEIKTFIELFTDQEFVGALYLKLPDSRMRKIATRLKQQTKNSYLLEALYYIESFNAKLDKLAYSTKYKELASNF